MTSTTSTIGTTELAAALTAVADILQARVDHFGTCDDGYALLDRRVCLQVAAGMPPTASFDLRAWAKVWGASRRDGTRPQRNALYEALCETLADELEDEDGRWEGRRDPAEIRRLASRLRSIETKVCLGGSLGPFDAMVDPTERWNGSISPRFTLDTAHELAAEIQRQAEHPDFVDDTVHVIDRGRTDRDGRPMAVVLRVSWLHLSEDGPDESTDVIEPDEEGRYAIGAWRWSWNFATWTCLCGHGQDWHVPTCESCGMARDRAVALNDSSRRVGEILRRLAPAATSILIDIHDGRAHVISAYAGDVEFDAADDGGVFDTETLGAADACLQNAIEGATHDELAATPGWQHTPDDESAHAWRITFPAGSAH